MKKRAYTYLFRNIDADLWERVSDRATSEGRTLRAVLLMLVEFYATHGLPKGR